MASKKGKLRDGKGVIDSTDLVPQFSVPGSEIIEIEEEKWSSIIKRWIKGVLGFVVILALVLAIIVTGLFSLILIYPAVGDNGERELVVRNTFSSTGGKPPIGSEMVISHNTYAPTNIWEWIVVGWTSVPNASIVTIESTDYDKLYIHGTPDNATVVNLADIATEGPFESSIPVDLDAKGDNFEFNIQLKNQYLVKCAEGLCDKDTYFVVNKEQIFGEIKDWNFKSGNEK